MLDANFAQIVKKPDNVPIVAMLFLVGFFWWLSMWQAIQNDERIEKGLKPLESSDGEGDKTWVWPDLVYTELLCMILGLIVLVAWGIAFIEYCMAVPANRFGSAVYTTAQLKTMQEIITLLVFALFSVLYLKEQFTLNYAIGFGFIALGAFFVFRGPL